MEENDVSIKELTGEVSSQDISIGDTITIPAKKEDKDERRKNKGNKKKHGQKDKKHKKNKKDKKGKKKSPNEALDQEELEMVKNQTVVKEDAIPDMTEQPEEAFEDAVNDTLVSLLNPAITGEEKVEEGDSQDENDQEDVLSWMFNQTEDVSAIGNDTDDADKKAIKLLMSLPQGDQPLDDEYEDYYDYNYYDYDDETTTTVTATTRRGWGWVSIVMVLLSLKTLGSYY